MKGAQIIVLATPVFLLLIAIEYLVGRARGRDTYRAADAMSSIGLGMLSQIVGVFAKVFTVGIYTLLYDHVAITKLPVDAWWVWLGALIAYDFLYYWLHRAGHRVALFWAAHVVHHQSEDYNLSTALRQTGSGWIAGWVFYLPMAVAGVPPLVFGTVALIDLLYQFWVHTQQVGRLGWFDRWFCSPSNHRVHHAVNHIYVDRNYGGIFMVWDRMFGTFQDELEAEPCIYGTRKPLRSWNPLWANLEVYAALAKDAWRARSWADKLRVWFMPPGWRPADVAAADPQPPFDIRAVRLYDPKVGKAALLGAAALFFAAMNVTTVLLWRAHELPLPTTAGLALAVLLTLWGVGRLTKGAAPRTAATSGAAVSQS